MNGPTKKRLISLYHVGRGSIERNPINSLLTILQVTWIWSMSTGSRGLLLHRIPYTTVARNPTIKVCSCLQVRPCLRSGNSPFCLMLLFTSLGSLLVMFGCAFKLSICFFRSLTLANSFSVLIGPINHIKHLVSRERIPFSIAYFSSLGLTLYFSLGVC